MGVEDVGRAACAVLRRRAAGAARACDGTRPEAPTFGEVADAVTAALGRAVRHRPVRVTHFPRGEVRPVRFLGLAADMAALCALQRTRRAASVAPDFGRPTGRPPVAPPDGQRRGRARFEDRARRPQPTMLCAGP